jgi:hypothetical protein
MNCGKWRVRLTGRGLDLPNRARSGEPTDKDIERVSELVLPLPEGHPRMCYSNKDGLPGYVWHERRIPCTEHVPRFSWIAVVLWKKMTQARKRLQVQGSSGGRALWIRPHHA